MEIFSKSNLIAILHLILIIIIYLSPWFLPWFYILALFLAYHLQLWLFKGCVMSQWQFGQVNQGFYYYYLKKIFPQIKSRRIDIIVDYVMPGIIVLIAYLVQLN